MGAITIIGAGPAGSRSAQLLAQRGHKVTVIEEHRCIGDPVQCTGVLTNSVNDILPVPEECIINRIKVARIYGSANKHIDILMKKKNIILDRAKFDRHLASEAESAGAKFLLKEKYLSFSRNRVITNKHKLKTDFLVGADGPSSTVAKTTGMFKQRNYFTGMQARIKIKCDPDTFEVFPSEGVYGWLVPEDEHTARVGVLAYENPRVHFDRLLKRRKGKILDYNAGLIPIYDPKLNIQKNNIFLIGDAASQVKATTGGGIIYGLMAAEELVNSIELNKNYNKHCKNRFGFDLWLSLKIRQVLDKFSPKDYDDLIATFLKPKPKKIIQDFDRDFPSKFIFQLALAEPRLLKYLFKLRP
ncbi:NAD(P)/FAD-dependent oxidoreductase [Candidatus Woesearchaeota archaeon]|nr:NAD(P)/FAD-dependent oxidoreductase [Candidatus Woesearchaeota archaeon]